MRRNPCSVTILCHKVSPPFWEKTGLRIRDVNIIQTLIRTKPKKKKKIRRNIKNKNGTSVGDLGSMKVWKGRAVLMMVTIPAVT